jgi:hypothetical protein
VAGSLEKDDVEREQETTNSWLSAGLGVATLGHFRAYFLAAKCLVPGLKPEEGTMILRLRQPRAAFAQVGKSRHLTEETKRSLQS